VTQRQIVNALFVRDGAVLVAKRSPQRRSYANCWSFPGGHVEPGESLEAALVREACEEIGLTPRRFRELAIIPEPDPQAHENAVYHLYAVTAWDGGDPRIRDAEHSELRWVGLDAAADLQPLALTAYREVFQTLWQDQEIAAAAMARFLAASITIDSNHPAVQRLAAEIRRPTPIETVRAAYETVRDRFPHSYDIHASAVSVSASDVLRSGHGICFAKSHLLAAVLRACDIPTALCYQKLARDDLAPGATCLHGLNAVWLAELGRWHRLDPRGNKPGIDARFDLARERLAYAIRPERGEADYHDRYAEPLPRVLAALRGYPSIAELDRNLPADIG
jgi:mutator protein MutT